MRGRPKREIPDELNSVEPDSNVQVMNNMTENIVKPKVFVDDKDEYNIQVITDYDGKVDVFYLSQKDPNYEYRYLRDEFKSLSVKTSNQLFSKGGWQIVPREHLRKIGIQERFISPDGMYRVGDLILARMPKELYAKKEEYKVKKANEPMDAIKRLQKEGDRSLAGLGHSNMRGIETAEKLGFK